MAIAKPFISVRPAADIAHEVASRPVTSYSPDQLRYKLDSNPRSFLHIINPEYSLPEDQQSTGRVRFEKVRQRYETFLSSGLLERADKQVYFLYKQAGPTGTFTGIIAGVSCQDYQEDRIKKHEQTLSKRESLFTDYLDCTNFNAEPVLLSYPDHSGLQAEYDRIQSTQPAIRFTSTDHISHTLWVVDDADTLTKIEMMFGEIRAFYIADGHHRSASSALLMEKRKAQNPAHNGTEAYNYFMAMLLPESALRIFPFHRVVKDLNHFSDEEFLEKASADFDISPLETPAEPGRGQVLFFTQNTVAMLTARNYDTRPGNIDAQMLTDRVLAPILGISDLRTDKRVDFTGGPMAFDQMIESVRSGAFRAGFALAPCTEQDIKHTADNGLTMPPKSTWIEPKMRSGLTIYEPK